ncbi:MAG: molybdopterin molybdotransferase MoeA [Acidobacteria bacterium]|nr:molybdopterin molybdotransferase MoeA [Acidobacteriota bacterium]
MNLSFSHARRIVLEQARSIPVPATESVRLEAAADRILAEPISADRDLPPFDRATRDGYAVRSSDLEQIPLRLEVTGELRAGADPQTSSCPVGSGEAIEIMTGAPMPPGADCVVMVEYTTRDAGYVTIRRGAAAGENVVRRGLEAGAGEVLLKIGTRLGPEQIAVAAACGRDPLRVFLKPTIAVLSTGDEVVDVAATPGPNQIRNSNAFALRAQIECAGGAARVLPVAPDEPRQLRALIEEGLACDLLLLSGGVSMGKHDLVEAALEELGAEFLFTGAEIQPGRPIVFGAVRSARNPHRKTTWFFGLPGNPISTMVCFEIFARAFVQALSGTEPARLRTAMARLQSGFNVKAGLTRFLPAIISGDFSDPQVAAVPWQGSGDVAAAAKGNCWLIVRPDCERLQAGELVGVLFR